jgi:hypothetical protein
MSLDAQECLRQINIVRDWCFDSSQVGYNKTQLFNSTEDFQTFVIPYMNPYFREPPKQLFLELWNLLQAAFYDKTVMEREFPIFLMKNECV